MNESRHISTELSLSEAWKRVEGRVRTAVEDGSHPFRTVALATADKTGSPQQRMVILRNFTDDSVFTVFTDNRSDKVDQILENSSVSLLFYDAHEKLQLRAAGKAVVIHDGEERMRYWNSRGSRNHYSYTSVIAPGTVIGHPREAYRWGEEAPSNFSLIKVEATWMEFLQLGGVRHIRAEKRIRQGAERVRWIAP